MCQRVEFPAAFFDALEGAGNIGFKALGPDGMKGFRGLLAGLVELLESLLDPGSGLGGGDFGKRDFGFVAQIVANVFHGDVGLFANGSGGGIEKHSFHLLMEIAHDQAGWLLGRLDGRARDNG